jgi:hypothetical protein
MGAAVLAALVSGACGTTRYAGPELTPEMAEAIMSESGGDAVVPLAPAPGQPETTGRIISVNPQTTVVEDVANHTVQIPTASIKRVRTSGSRRTVQGGSIGFALGAVVGGLIGNASHTPCPGDWCIDAAYRAGDIIGGALIGGLLTALAGLAVGAASGDTYTFGSFGAP